jgi:hypothetical protein
MRIVSLVFIAVLITSPAVGETAVSGIGARDCEFMNSNVPVGSGWAKNVFNQSVMSWIQGFASGINILKIQVEKKFFDLATVSVDEQWAIVVAYCRRNPTRLISHAANDLLLQRFVEKRVPK